MNRSEPDLRTSAVLDLAPAANVIAADTGRLVVVILDAEQEAILASRILAVARPRALHILLVGVALDPAAETELRRKLVTLAAFLRDERLPAGSQHAGGNQAFRVEIQMERGRDWLDKIKYVLKPGDTLACYAEQSIGARPRPLGDLLSSNLNVPIYTFSGLRASHPVRKMPLAQAASWAGSIAAIGGFLILQARIVVAMQGWAQTVLLLVTVFAEVGLLWFLNSLFAGS